MDYYYGRYAVGTPLGQYRESANSPEQAEEFRLSDTSTNHR